MRKRSAATAAFLLLGLTAAPSAAAEKPKPVKPAEARVMAAQPKMSAQDLYKAQLDEYLDAVRLRQDALDDINRAFAAAVKRAQKAFKTARTLATSADAKMSAEAMRKAAIAVATAARQAAIDELGPAPVKPMKPLAPVPTASATPTPSATSTP